MSEKVAKGSAGIVINKMAKGDSQLIPMSLFAAWDVDRTPPNCVPRLCSLTLSRLTVLKPLGSDVNSVTLACKMQSSKRTLRSNEITLSPGGLLDTALELKFALSYPHYLKQWEAGNRLQIMLQRRKRYKNRTILGYKTLCSGTINMAAAVQRQMDMDLELYGETAAGAKENLAPLARVQVHALSSQPVDHEETADRLKTLADGAVERAGALLAGVGRPGFLRYEVDEDDDDFSTDGSDSDQPRGTSGVGPVAGAVSGGGNTDRRTTRISKTLLQNRGKIPNARQRNLKQKFIALLKKFKITEDLENDADEGCIDPSKLTGADLEMDAGDIEDLIDELEDLSDSGPEMDTLSVTSTPKPALRPFFASSRSLLAPDPSASAYGGYPSGFIDRSSFVSGTGGWLERHYSDESSKRNDSDSTHGESLWTDREDRESDTPVASQQCPPPTFPTQNALPCLDDKTKEVKRNRLFYRERSGPSLACTAGSAGAPLRDAKKSPGTPGSGGPISSPSPSTAAKANESSPRKILLDQLVRCMPADDGLPDQILMISGADLQGCNLASRLAERQQRAVCTGGAADVRATIACLVSKIQKFCYSSAKPPPPVKVLLVGPDSYVNSVLRAYVEQFSSKPPDWKNYLKFYVVPLVSNAGSNNNNNSSANGSNGIGCSGSNHTLARYLASLDRYYSLNFVSDSWREALDRPNEKLLLPAGGSEAAQVPGAPIPSKIDVQEVIHRLGRYLTSNGCTLQIPIAEAMITYCEPGSDEESTQVFIPFVSEVRIGIAESSAAAAFAALGSVDTDDGQQMSVVQPSCAPAVSSSPPHQSPLLVLNPMPAALAPASADKADRDKVRTTPPSSPNISSLSAHRDIFNSGGESVELQVDYWLSGQSAIAAAAAASNTRESIASAAAASLATMVQAVKREKGPPINEQTSVKYTVKAGFRWIVVQRLLNTTGDGSSLFTMTFGLKEKKQKIMRLGKKKEKEKDSEPKSQVVEGINRLVCQAKTHHSLLKVVIDGVEWNNVKFFQLSSQWQTHVRHFPVVLFAESLL